MRVCEPSKDHYKAMASLLYEGFRHNWPKAWPSHVEALEEVIACHRQDYICLVAIEDDQPVGWIGARPEYDGNVWELHPLAVDEKKRKRGLGSALVEALEDKVKDRGGLMIQLGTDDENDMTSLSGTDLFDQLWDKVKNIENYKGHPYEFYQRLGYQIIGVIPHANGP